MKRLLSVIISLTIVLSPYSAAHAAGTTDTADTINEVRACIFPADGEKDIEAAIALLLPLAERGSAEAQYYLGWILKQELQDHIQYSEEATKESFKWFRLAMEQGFLKAYAALCLFDLHEAGDDIAREAVRAGLLELSDEELCTDGFYLIASLYRNGIGVEQDYAKALEWYRKAAADGYALSMTMIGYLYRYGEGVALDNKKALDWFLKAAEGGECFAMYELVNIYDGVLDDIRTAFYWKYQCQDTSKVIRLYSMGVLYKYGCGVEQDSAKAQEYFAKAEDFKKAIDLRNLAVEYCTGSGSVPVDYSAAMNCYIDAYLLGDELSLERINYMLQDGHGVEVYERRADEVERAKGK